MSIVYTLLDGPVPWARAGKNGKHFYDTQKQQKLVAGISLRNQHGDLPLYEGPLHLDITFYMPIAKTSQERRELADNTFHFIRPDSSNLLKHVEDSAKGVLYKDDCLIAKITLNKVYSVNPRTVFTITEIPKCQRL